MFVFEPGKKYSFTTLAPQILGNEFTSAVVKSVMGWEEASREEDIISIQQMIYGFAQEANLLIPRDYKQLTYLKVETSAGNRRIIAREWILADSIKEISQTNIQITIYDVSSDKINLLEQMLIENGFTGFELTSKAHE